MGGTIAVTLATPEGEICRMARWTNPLPEFIMNPQFIGDDREWVEEFLSHWREMKLDYEINKKTGEFQFPMTECYHPFDVCAPTGYGLVFIDMQSKVIHEHQGYCSFTRVYSYHFNDPETAPVFNQFAEEGRLTLHKLDRRHKRWIKTSNKTGRVEFAERPYWGMIWRSMKYNSDLVNLEHLGSALRVTLSNWWHRRVDEYSYFELDLSPYTVVDWEEAEGSRSEQFVQMKAAIAQLIDLTPEDEAAWDEWIAEVKAEEQEDAEIDDVESSDDDDEFDEASV